MTGTAAWVLLVRFLTFCIPVPVVAIAAIGAWLWWDRGSAMRHAVDKAVAELVAGGEIAGLKAQVASLQRAKLATDYAYSNYGRRLAADEAQAAKDEETERVAHDAQGTFGDRPWTVHQSDIDWVR
ncbi:MAG: hypothetical protein BGN87_06340 [Rhizobiales bacterium 65-79]|jgi:hypothetical protein|nr:hypothetical protein [Hyphomicrobiales bacterium]OJU02809.1 MAG: hypothetical protein BGN87_06340 [Rhizobiales bacterium 65-79]